MQDVIEFLQKQLSPGLARIAVVFILVYFALIGVVRLFEVWRSLRTRRAILEEEKLFNEILKLRYETEALRKQHGLADLLAAPAQPLAPGAIAGSGLENSNPLFRFHLKMPELPALSLLPLFSAVSLRLHRPPAGAQRAIWALKWLAAAIGIFILVIIIATAIVGETVWQSTAMDVFFAMAFIVGTVLVFTVLYNVCVGLVSFVNQHWRHRPDKSGN